MCNQTFTPLTKPNWSDLKAFHVTRGQNVQRNQSQLMNHVLHFSLLLGLLPQFLIQGLPHLFTWLPSMPLWHQPWLCLLHTSCTHLVPTHQHHLLYFHREKYRNISECIIQALHRDHHEGHPRFSCCYALRVHPPTSEIKPASYPIYKWEALVLNGFTVLCVMKAHVFTPSHQKELHLISLSRLVPRTRFSTSSLFLTSSRSPR